MRLFIANRWLSLAALSAIAVAVFLCAAPFAGAVAPAALRPGAPSVIRVQAVPRGAPLQGAPRVYLLRGFLNVFSLGMDDIAARLRAAGISALVTNHADEDLIASRITANYNAGDRGPIVLIGHSLGADAIVDVADALARYNIPVALLVMFDGTMGHEIPGNVASAINYTKHFLIAPVAGSHGTVSNVDLSNDPQIDHLNIDAAPALQAQTVDAILQMNAAAGREPAMRRH